MHILRSTVTAFALLTLAGAVQAEEMAADGGMAFEEKLAACAACHGENGAKPILPEYPILAGQHADYIASALHAYKSGRRQNPIMAMQVETLQLSDADIERLAAHFAAQSGVVTLAP